jgi:hypothetical protein
VKNAIGEAARWVVAGVGFALAWIAVASTPSSKPDQPRSEGKS